MNINQIIDIFIKQKVKEKRLKIKITGKTDLFIQSIFDSLDFAEFRSYLEKKSIELDLKKNKYKIPRSKFEILKVIKFTQNRSNKNIKRYQKLDNDINVNFLTKIKSNFKIKKNQNLIIHSNFSKLVKFGIHPKTFIKEIFNNFPSITIFTPAGFFRKKFLRVKSRKKVLPSNEFGILTKEILKLPQKKLFRNDNPFDNLVGYNLKGKYFKGKNILAYGKDSPYRKLLKKKTSVLLLDVSFFYNSMFHMAELDAKVPYRKFINFNFLKKTFKLYARKKQNLFLDYSKFEKIKKIKDLTKRIKFLGVKIYLIDYKSLYKESLKILKKKPTFLITKS